MPEKYVQIVGKSNMFVLGNVLADLYSPERLRRSSKTSIHMMWNTSSMAGREFLQEPD